MREHAIPQDVTGYRFHIIGNMTLKQFAEVGAGVLVGVLIYTTNLPNIIKWPFICISVGLGALAAFVPLEERPFDHWLVTFGRILYKPTKYYWKRQSKIPDPFLYQPGQVTTATNELDLGPARRDRIREYLTSVEPEPDLNQFDVAEANQLQGIMGAFSTVQTPTRVVNRGAHKPDLRVRVRAIKPPAGEFQLGHTRLAGVTEPEVTIMPDEEVQVVRPGLQVGQVAQDIVIPEVQPIAVEGNDVTAEDVAYQTATSDDPERAFVESGAAPELLDNSANQVATINQDLPFPDPPTEPNKLVGMVLSPDNNLINDAIVEIADQTGRVARAVKTNALGQFFITTPLDNGAYTISVEHDGYQFAPLSIELGGKAVPPIEIRSAT